MFALVGGAVFYFLLLTLSNREKIVRNRDLQQRVEEQAAQIQAIEARLRFVETALCQRGTINRDDGGTQALASLTPGSDNQPLNLRG